MRNATTSPAVDYDRKSPRSVIDVGWHRFYNREPAADFADEPDDSAEYDDQAEDDDRYEESVFDRIEWSDFVAKDSLDGPIGGEG